MNKQVEKKHIGFLDMFPTPEYLTMPSVSLAIDDSTLRYIRLEKKIGHIVVADFGEYPIEPGAVVDGEIQKTEVVVALLKKIKEETGVSFVRVALPEERGYLFVSRIPQTEIGELTSAVEVAVEENAPVKVSDVVYDFIPVPRAGQNGEMVVAVSAVPRAIVETYQSVIGEAGLSPLSFEMESAALARASTERGDTRCGLLVGIAGGNKLVHTIVRDNTVLFTSVTSLLSNSLDEIVGGTKKIIAYWGEHMEDEYGMNASVEYVSVYGDNKRVGEYEASLRTKLDIPVMLSDVWVNVCSLDHYVPPIEKSKSLAFGTVIGLSLSSF